MPKNSRPDIQVLEARVIRLKAQLLEYKDIRTYEITKQRLMAVASELEECVSIIGSITDREGVSTRPSVALKEPETVDNNEFNDDGDLADILFMEPKASFDSNSTNYSPKEIIHNYAVQLKECAGSQTGIIQVNQFCFLLNSWFQERFIPEIKNPNFHYNAKRIHEWVDLLILSAGKSLHKGKFSEFKAYMDEWIEGLNTSKDDGWLVPLKVRQVEKEPGAYTKEAVLLETIVKKMLYNDQFYIEERRSISQIVKQKAGFEADELTVAALVEACPKMIRTSSFDITKYQ